MPKRVLVDETNDAPAPKAAPERPTRSNMAPRRSRLRRRWWSISGALLAIAALAWIGYLIDPRRLLAVATAADPLFLLILPFAVCLEQLVRAWKWRQLLLALKPVGTFQLFGTIMAGYLANMLVPLGVSPFVRAWLVGRLEQLPMSTVLATVAIDRFVDGLVFVGFVAVVLVVAAFPDPDGRIGLGLLVGAIGSLVLFSLVLLGLALLKPRARSSTGWIAGLIRVLAGGWADRVGKLLVSFADGITWPKAPWRQAAVVLASVVIKLIALAHLLWAGLAFGVILTIEDYIFLLVFLGFLIILSRLARIPGGFIVGGMFALGLLDVPDEEAVLIVTSVQLASMLAVAVAGSLALWRGGLSLDDLRRRRDPDGRA